MSTLTNPTNLVINGGTSHTGSNAQLSWLPAIGSGGTGSVIYDVLLNGGETLPVRDHPHTHYTIEKSFWGPWAANETFELQVCAWYGNLSAYSNVVYFTYQHLSLTNPTNLRINGATSHTGNTAVLTWTPATGSGGSGAVTYDVLINGGAATAASGIAGNSYTIPEAYWRNFSANTSCTLTVVARYNGESANTNNVVFTFQPRNTLSVRDGANWVACIPHYFNGTSWVACIPYYHQNGSWVECSNG